MTVERMSQEMSYPEFVGWMALASVRAEERKRAEAQQKKGMRSR
jgi:hypothetical protein